MFSSLLSPQGQWQKTRAKESKAALVVDRSRAGHMALLCVAMARWAVEREAKRRSSQVSVEGGGGTSLYGCWDLLKTIEERTLSFRHSEKPVGE